MHLLRSLSQMRAFQISASLVFLNIIFLFIAVCIIIHSIVLIDGVRTLIGFGFAAFAMLLELFRALLFGHCRCPICMANVLNPFNRTPHREARTLIGSHRLPVAISILFQNSFRCPSCNEPTAIRLHPQARK